MALKYYISSSNEVTILKERKRGTHYIYTRLLFTTDVPLADRSLKVEKFFWEQAFKELKGLEDKKAILQAILGYK